MTDSATIAAPQGPEYEIDGMALDAATLGELVERRAALGEKPLLSVGDDVVSYAAADERSNRIAGALAACGVGRGDVVATLLYNSPDHLCIWFACAKLGAIFAPLNVALVGLDLEYALSDSTAKVLIVEAELAGAYMDVRAALDPPPLTFARGTGGEGETARLQPFAELLDGDPTPPGVEVLSTEPVGILYTGGSTGMPKGVAVSHRYYLASSVRYLRAAEPGADDVHFGVGHLFHAGGQCIGVMGPLYAGISTALVRWFSASRYWDRARAHGATIIDPIGPIVAAVMAQPSRPDDAEHSVRLGVGVATAQIRRELRDGFEQRFGVPLLEVYAQAETGVILISETLADRRGSNGRPTAAVDVRIVDEAGYQVPAGVSGEITIRLEDPNSFMLGYWRKPEQTASSCRGLRFHTGDLGHLDEDGYLYFTGRQAHWIRCRGENVSAFEVEQVVGSHPAVLDCAAVGVEGELGDEDVKVFVQLREAVSFDPAELVGFCAGRISYFKIPRYVEVIAELPRSAAKQEIERHRLRELGIGEAWDRQSESAASG